MATKEKEIMASNKKLTFEKLQEAMNALSEAPEKVTEILLGMPREKYETVKNGFSVMRFPIKSPLFNSSMTCTLKNA
jgi:hypothetical protein